jgi:hypothetical protein
MGKNRVSKPFDERRRIWKQIGVVVVALSLLLVFLVPLASRSPDGLDRAAEDLGASEGVPLFPGLFPDYLLPVGSEWIGTVLAGILGMLVVLASMLLVTRIIILRRMR